jgi:hypothetical protein
MQPRLRRAHVPDAAVVEDGEPSRAGPRYGHVQVVDVEHAVVVSRRVLMLTSPSCSCRSPLHNTKRIALAAS